MTTTNPERAAVVAGQARYELAAANWPKDETPVRSWQELTPPEQMQWHKLARGDHLTERETGK